MTTTYRAAYWVADGAPGDVRLTTEDEAGLSDEAPWLRAGIHRRERPRRDGCGALVLGDYHGMIFRVYLRSPGGDEIDLSRAPYDRPAIPTPGAAHAPARQRKQYTLNGTGRRPERASSRLAGRRAASGGHQATGQRAAGD